MQPLDDQTTVLRPEQYQNLHRPRRGRLGNGHKGAATRLLVLARESVQLARRATSACLPLVLFRRSKGAFSSDCTLRPEGRFSFPDPAGIRKSSSSPTPST